MQAAKKSEDQPWLKYVVLPLLLIFFGLFTSYLYLSRTNTTPRSLQGEDLERSRKAAPTPTPTPTPPQYVCPTTPWVDCMPVIGTAKLECTSDYLTWIKANCPDFQGVAY